MSEAADLVYVSSMVSLYSDAVRLLVAEHACHGRRIEIVFIQPHDPSVHDLAHDASHRSPGDLVARGAET